MVDTSAANRYLRSTLSNLERTTTSWILKLEDIVSHTAFELSRELSDDNFFVDKDNIDTLQKIYDYMADDTTDAWLLKKLEAEESWLTWWTSATVKNAYNSLIRAAWKGNRNLREKECEKILDFAKKFDLDTELKDITDAVWRTTWWPIILDLSGMTTAVPDPEYKLCDQNWNELKYNAWSGAYQIRIGWKNVKITWIKVDEPNHRIEFENIKLDPADTDISSPIQLSVSAFYGPSADTWNLKVVSNKTFSLKLNDSVILNETNRKIAINSYNTAWWKVIENHLNNTFVTQEKKLLKDAIERLVSKWSTVFSTLTNEQKDDFLNKMLDTDITTIPGIPSPASWTGREWLAAVLESYNKYSSFCKWFASEDRKRNKDWKNTKSKTAYNQFIHDHFRWEASNYFVSKLDECLQKNISTERFLKAKLSDYLVEAESNQIDNSVIRDNVEDIFKNDDVRIRKDKWIWQWWKVLKIEPIRKKDSNYMRFFSKSSKEISDQTINLSTGQVKYNMKLNVNENNKLWVEIKIDWKEPIIIQSWDYDPATLARRILREPRIETSKARVHMVYNLYKWLLQIAKDKNIKLEYYEDWTPWKMHEITLADNWNIILNTVEYWGTPPYKKKSEPLFNEAIFKSTNQFDSLSHNNSLEEWVYEIAKHFSYSMNRMHDSYRKSIKRGFWRWLQRWGKTNLPTSFWSSPIRKILNINNVTNFDFSTNVGNVRIELKNNTFIVNTPDSPVPITSKSLWKILNTRIKGKRIFDWIERDIVEAIYSNLIKKMRENSKVAHTHFGVMDEITWHVYVLDPSGHFWRINRDALNWKNIFNFWWDSWIISEKIFRWSSSHPWYTYQRLSSTEEKELLKNPLLMQKLIKAMNRRMGLVESIRAWIDRN